MNDEAQRCRRKADQHWEMAGLARQDNDPADADRQTKLAKHWEEKWRQWEDHSL